MPDTITLEFTKEKDTKNAVRFAEVTDLDRGIVGSIYVLKSSLESLGNPTNIVVTITAVG